MVQHLCYILCRQHGTGSFITPNYYLLKTAQWMQDPLLLLLFIYLSQQGATFFLLHQIAIYWIQHGTGSFITPNCYLLKTAWCKIFAISSVDSMVQDLLSRLIAIYWRQHGAKSFITPNCNKWIQHGTGSFITPNCYLGLLTAAMCRIFYYT